MGCGAIDRSKPGVSLAVPGSSVSNSAQSSDLTDEQRGEETIAQAAETSTDAAIAPVTVAPVTVTPVTVATGLEHPWGMAWLPDGSLLITERPGRVQWLKPGPQNGQGNPPATLKTIPGVPPLLAAGQGGLMDIALHPNFEQKPWVYFTYSDGSTEANRTKVARAKFDGEKLTDWQEIFANADAKRGTQHFGARLAWLLDDTLLVSLGDGGNPPVSFDGDLIRKQAQNLGTHFGKVLRLNADGSVPTDNPFVGQAGAKPEIWSYGHRNIQGLAVDSATGTVWATEHGSQGGDEFNRLSPGSNYGWPEVSFSKEYGSGQAISPQTSKPGLVDPLLEWTPALAPSGLTVYRDGQIPSWQGNLFAGGLRAQQVRRITVDGSGRAADVETFAFDQRVRDVRQGPDGLLYVLTDDANGKLIRLEPKLGSP
ncbi:MAG: PQQ-dependent sugar dehydrogenase [Synechococcales cyanobacterium RM1_1_8]|nr:PQQ-dependent sugar dehydrogenase [Synechococcales cyanobacterium RM1_1_8]